MTSTGALTPADAAVFETFVVPRYMAYFGELALELLLAGEGSRIAHLGCRTGYPDKKLVELAPSSTLTGVDESRAAIELARNKVAAAGDEGMEYLEAPRYPTALASESFSHAITLHPVASAAERVELFQEMHRLLYAGGQALVALPLRGSFQEVLDLLREYALKFDEGDLGRVVEEAMAGRHTIETLSEELEGVGLDDIDVEVRHTTLTFDSGRAFVEDPVTRLLVLPDVQTSMPKTDLSAPFDYVRDAVDKYWSEGKFELTLNVGCASARRVG